MPRPRGAWIDDGSDALQSDVARVRVEHARSLQMSARLLP
jgi:hypothetical protein